MIGASSSQGSHRARRLRRVSLAGLLAATLAACAVADGSDRSSGSGASTGAPEGAIRVDEDLYQVPVGRDDRGCQMYRLHSSSRMVPQAIYYRTADGDFTMDRDAAACTDDG